MFVPKKGGTLEILIYYWLTSGQYSYFIVSIHVISELKYKKHVSLHVGGGMAKVLQLQQASCVWGGEYHQQASYVCGVESTTSRRPMFVGWRVTRAGVLCLWGGEYHEQVSCLWGGEYHQQVSCVWGGEYKEQASCVFLVLQ